MPHRYFTQDILGNFARITGPDAHHLARVMRAKEGDEITLCDGQGTDMTARVTDVGPEAVMLEVLDRTPSTAEPPLKVTLFVAYPKLDKLETIIQKGVELGASAIQPFTSRYCVAQPKKEEQKLERRRRIALEAAKQCGRGAVPAVEAPVEFFSPAGPAGRVRPGHSSVRGGRRAPAHGAGGPARERPPGPHHRQRGRLCPRRGRGAV